MRIKYKIPDGIKVDFEGTIYYRYPETHNAFIAVTGKVVVFSEKKKKIETAQTNYTAKMVPFIRYTIDGKPKMRTLESMMIKTFYPHIPEGKKYRISYENNNFRDVNIHNLVLEFE